MDFLSNTQIQFVISSSISIISIGIGLWIAFRRPQIPIAYETVEIEPVSEVQKVKELIETLQIAPDDETIQHLCFVTCKIWNAGRNPLVLSDEAKPIIVAFNQGEKILDCKRVETIPDDLELTYKFDTKKIFFMIPLLKSEETITFRILLANYLLDFPSIGIRIPDNIRFVKANNVRRSKEIRIAAIVYFCTALSICFFLYTGFFSFQHNFMADFYYVSYTVLFLLASVLFFIISWFDRQSVPYPASFMLPSTYISLYGKLFLRTVPILIGIGLVAALIYFFLGVGALIKIFFIAAGILVPLGLWSLFYVLVYTWLRKRKKMYPAVLVGILTGIPCLALLMMCISVFLTLPLHR